MVIAMGEFKWSLIRCLSVLLLVPWLWLSSPVEAADRYYTCVQWKGGCDGVPDNVSAQSFCDEWSAVNSYTSMYGPLFEPINSDSYYCGYKFSEGGSWADAVQLYPVACTEANKSTQGHICYEETVICPEPGTLYSGPVSESGVVGSGYTDSDGCSLSPNWKPTFCDYPGAEEQECVILDGYKYGDPEPPPKLCRDESGRLLGQVSGNAECPIPQRSNCYNPDGTLGYIVDSGTSCPDGTSTENTPDGESVTDSDIDPETGEPTGEKTTGSTETTDVQVVSNPDGSVTTTTTTTTTNSDGSTSTTTKTSTVNADGSSSETTETTGTEPAVGVSGGQTCDVEPACNGDPIQCYQVKRQWRTDCHKDELVQGFSCGDEFVCKGGPIECYSLRLQHERACILGDKSAAQQVVAEAIQSGELPAGDTDEWGQLSALDAGQFNLEEQFNVGSMWSDSGGSGSCPAPIQIAYNIKVSFEPLCELAGYIRAFVIFMATWISFSMLSQTLIGTRWW